MPWPPGYLLNRKSRLGHRPLARMPRAHRQPWFTTPPIASETEETMEGQQQQNDRPTEPMRRILRSLVSLVASKGDDPKQIAAIEGMDDVRLAALAQEALANITRAKKLYDSVDTGLGDMRKELDRIKAEHRQDERALAEAQKAIRERDDIAAKYRELQKQVDPDAAQLKIMYAIDEATKAMKDEAAGLRRELAQRQTEVNELKASKKRLREALDRLAGKD